MSEQKKWIFSISFEGLNKKLSASNGLSMYDLTFWFEGLKDLITKEDTKNINLVAIKDGSYKTVLETEDEEVASAISDIHEAISISEPFVLENEKKYVNNLKKIISTNQLKVQVQVDNNFNDRKKTFDIVLDNFNTEPVKYYYQIDRIEGVVTTIGGKKNDKRSIWIDGFSKKIQITEEQDLALKHDYRTSIISAMIEKKRRVDNRKIVSANLLSYKKIREANCEISIEGIRKCFENNSIFTLEDLEKFENSRLPNYNSKHLEN